MPGARRSLESVNTTRVALWDNTRFIAIVLVVWGHSLTRAVAESSLAGAAYFWLYSFHIPLFVLLAGYFAKADPLDGTRMRRIVTDLVAPYLILEIVWSAIHSIDQGKFHFDPLRPSWTLWFLLSLAAWRVLLPFLATLRWPLSISVVVSVASGYFAVDQTLSLARTLGLLPFFVLGWMAASNARIQRFAAGDTPRSRVMVVVAITVLVASAALAWLSRENLISSGARWLLTYDRPYAESGVDQWWAGAVRLGLMAIALVTLAAMVYLMPRSAVWFTRYGGATLYVYLLHSFLLAPLRASGVLSGDLSWWVLGLTLPGSFLIAWLLSTEMVRKLTKPIIQPALTWLAPRR